MIRRLGFEEEPAAFKHAPQNARVWTEGWVSRELYCLSCGAEALTKLANNSPVADFKCQACAEEYELKSKSGKIGAKIVDGAHKTMLERLAANNNPNLIVLGYNRAEQRVSNLSVVQRQFFVPTIIEERKPLAPTAKRAGWVGCNILLDLVPNAGKIIVVRDGMLEPKETVLRAWRKTSFLLQKNMSSRGWLIETLRCVERIGKSEFELSEVYAFEFHLQEIFPDNQHVREKIRQQLQVLRDQNIVEFLGRGRYRLTSA